MTPNKNVAYYLGTEGAVCGYAIPRILNLHCSYRFLAIGNFLAVLGCVGDLRFDILDK